jgi:hypothetical protein
VIIGGVRLARRNAPVSLSSSAFRRSLALVPIGPMTIRRQQRAADLARGELKRVERRRLWQDRPGHQLRDHRAECGFGDRVADAEKGRSADQHGGVRPAGEGECREDGADHERKGVRDDDHHPRAVAVGEVPAGQGQQEDGGKVREPEDADHQCRPGQLEDDHPGGDALQPRPDVRDDPGQPIGDESLAAQGMPHTTRFAAVFGGGLSDITGLAFCPRH